MGNDFFYAQPVKIWFGDGCFERLGEVLDELKVRRAVLVCGTHFAGEAQQLKEKLPAICAIFSAVEPNPQLSGVAETARLARDCQADAVIGIGGGSAMDTAKYAAAIAPGDAEAEQYYRGALPLPEKALSIICVPPTAGTGREVIGYAMYPQVFEEYMRDLKQDGDLSRMGSDIYFYGLSLGETCQVKVSDDQELTITLLEIREPDENGYRDLLFEVNGHTTLIKIADESVVSAAFEDRPAFSGGIPGQQY